MINNFKLRLISIFLIAPITLLFVTLGDLYFYMLLSIIFCLGFKELFTLKKNY